jgi:hypothetical protein
MIYSSPIRTLASTAGRYPTEAEERTVLAWAQSLPERLRAVNQIAQKEADIVRETIEEMKPRYPRFGPQHERAYEKGARDMQLLLRYAAQTMVVDDADMAPDKLYVWYGTIVRSLGITPQFMKDACETMVEACRRNLNPDVFHVAEPYLNRMAADVPAYPEPMKPAVH